MSVNAFKRYELKFLLSKEQFDALLPKLTQYMNPDQNCKYGCSYNIYNIYYDTFDNSLIRKSLSKPVHKEKLRLRSYTIPNAPDSKVYLELKKKTAGIVHKRRAAMTLNEAYDFISFGKKPSAKNYIGSQVNNEIEYFLSRYEVFPAAYISYTRIAYFGKEDKDFRVTFDSNIITRRNELYLEKGCFGEQLLEEGQYLMEVKISRAVPVWLAETLSELKIYKRSFSKYGKEYSFYLQSNLTNNSGRNFRPPIMQVSSL